MAFSLFSTVTDNINFFIVKNSLKRVATSVVMIVRQSFTKIKSSQEFGGLEVEKVVVKRTKFDVTSKMKNLRHKDISR